MFLQLDRPWQPVLDSAAVIVAQAGAHIPDPGGGHPARTTGADELVKQHVGDGSDQLQVLPPLADELVARGKWNEPFQGHAQRHRRAVRHVCPQRLGQVKQLAVHRH